MPDDNSQNLEVALLPGLQLVTSTSSPVKKGSSEWSMASRDAISGYSDFFLAANHSGKFAPNVLKESFMTDLTDIKKTLDTLEKRRPGASIHAVAWTAVGATLAGIMAIYTITSSSHDDIEKSITKSQEGGFRVVDNRLNRIDARIDSVENHAIENGKAISSVEGKLTIITGLLQKDSQKR
jgi:hypothetical protein